MALPDIKDAGALAGFSVWGWPYHGVCQGGFISLPNATVHPMTQPTNNLTWLIDMGLPAIVRSPAELLADAANGFEWRNYALIAGGTIYNKPLSVDQYAYIHVDSEQKSWLIKIEAPQVLPETVVLSFLVARFGELKVDATLATPIQVIIQVPNISLTPWAMELEDVWTNGAKALLGFYQITTSPSVTLFKDMFSLIEVSISGAGGVDGSGLIFGGAVIRNNSQLNLPETITVAGLIATAPRVPGYTYVCVQDPQTSVSTCQYVQSGTVSYQTALGSGGMRDGEIYDYSKTRFAYYKPDGTAVAAKMKIGYRGDWTINSLTLNASGVDTNNPANGTWTYGAHAVYSGNASGVLRQGIYLMEDNAIVDKIEYVQGFTEVRTVDEWRGGNPVITYTTNSPLYDVGRWETSLPVTIPIPASRNEQGQVLFTVALTLMNYWRALYDDLGGFERSRSGVDAVTWGSGIGIQRIAERAAGFFTLSGQTRTYGSLMSPYGVVASGITAAGNIYLTGNRKTGATVTSTNSICLV